MKFATKPMRHYRAHFRHVATLHWLVSDIAVFVLKRDVKLQPTNTTLGNEKCKFSADIQ